VSQSPGGWNFPGVENVLLSHAGVAEKWDKVISEVCDFVCLCVGVRVRAVTGERLELSTPNLLRVYFMVVAWYAVTRRSKGQRSRSHGYENCHGRTVAVVCCCDCADADVVGVNTLYDCLGF